MSAYTDPHEALLAVDLERRWTTAQLERHIVEAVKYGVAMERDRILSATSKLTYD